MMSLRNLWRFQVAFPALLAAEGAGAAALGVAGVWPAVPSVVLGPRWLPVSDVGASAGRGPRRGRARRRRVIAAGRAFAGLVMVALNAAWGCRRGAPPRGDAGADVAAPAPVDCYRRCDEVIGRCRAMFSEKYSAERDRQCSGGVFLACMNDCEGVCR